MRQGAGACETLARAGFWRRPFGWSQKPLLGTKVEQAKKALGLGRVPIVILRGRGGVRDRPTMPGSRACSML